MGHVSIKYTILIKKAYILLANILLNKDFFI